MAGAKYEPLGAVQPTQEKRKDAQKLTYYINRPTNWGKRFGIPSILMSIPLSPQLLPIPFICKFTLGMSWLARHPSCIIHIELLRFHRCTQRDRQQKWQQHQTSHGFPRNAYGKAQMYMRVVCIVFTEMSLIFKLMITYSCSVFFVRSFAWPRYWNCPSWQGTDMFATYKSWSCDMTWSTSCRFWAE